MPKTAALLEDISTLNASSDLYLDLMKRCVTDWIYLDPKADNQISWLTSIKLLVFALRTKIMSPLEMLNSFVEEEDAEKNRIDGLTPFPGRAHTMVGLKRLDNLQGCIEDVLARNVPGDFFEAGVWRGGVCIFMRAMLKAYGIQDRTVWLADSFEGLPAPNAKKYPADAGWTFHWFDEIAISLEQVKSNFSRYGLLDSQVQFLKGWFCDTLPNAQVTQLAILRADGDMYESTMDIFTNLYSKVSIGGYVIIDDYNIAPGCKQAVDDFRKANGITDELRKMDTDEFYWIRSQ
ncbi:MAG: macrocin O-methyltransferase [Cyanothece sp. SIO2G6]|nr:macrocin O-methyltransferase [Cyanothece sp. SIO2G6]